MKALIILSLLFSLHSLAAPEVCTDGTNTLTLDFDSMTFELDETHGSLIRDGMNWAGQIYSLIFENGEQMKLLPNHFDNGRNLVIERDNIRNFGCD